MSNSSIIEIKNLGKKYNIRHQKGGYVTLRDVLANVFKNPFRFAKQKAKEVAGVSGKEEFWALKDINMEIKKGEVVGIIGANGAGKSTLLKILSQITPPTTGEIIINGTVSSLLEVGTGFHPELTGRENIFLNGAILGMTREEMAKKFDDIVQFAGIEKFLDTQVKHYSSGMYVRLAFSVAAHLEPDILIVDEVLAVGDADFQKKSLGKMEEITKKEGRTILFVSHNMAAIQEICNKCIIIEGGKIKAIGNPREVIADYLSSSQKNAIKIFEKNEKKEAKIIKVAIKNNEGDYTTNLSLEKPFFVEIDYELNNPVSAYLVLKIFKSAIPKDYIVVSLSSDNNQQNPKDKGVYKASVRIDPLLNSGIYSLLIGVATNTDRYLDHIIEYDTFSISNMGALPFAIVNNGRTDSIIIAPMEWKIYKL